MKLMLNLYKHLHDKKYDPIAIYVKLVQNMCVIRNLYEILLALVKFRKLQKLFQNLRGTYLHFLKN